MAQSDSQQTTKIVVKLGTSTLCDESGALDAAFIADLAAQIVAQVREGASFVIVSSGAIRAGLDLLTLPHSPRSIPLKQAAAAVGQGRLMQFYADAFAAHGLVVAQILLTRDDFHDRKRYINAANTLRALNKLGVIPIINENDTIAVEEIKVGDNDTLGALVAGLIGADLLVLLSDIDGLYTADPNRDPDAKLIPVVTDIAEIESAASDPSGDWGTGGMRTKIEAARICVRSRIPMVIAHGRLEGVLRAAISGETGTRFVPPAKRSMPARKRWIAGAQRSAGSLTVHEAACSQLVHRGRSLLPAGVTGVDGEFNAGDLVVLVDPAGIAFARGIVNYDHSALRRIMGLKTVDVKAIYGEQSVDEVIHRDNLVVGPQTSTLRTA